MHETLITKEEMLLAKDLGNYYRICTDDRGLNYDKYFSSGNKRKIVEDYSSNNTKLLNKEENDGFTKKQFQKLKMTFLS